MLHFLKTFENLSAVSPELRYTSMYPCAAHPIVLACNGESKEAVEKATKRMLKQHATKTLSLLAPPLRVLVQVESSGKWPLEAEAIRKTKIALLLKTRTELKSQLQVTNGSCILHSQGCHLIISYYVYRFPR